LIQLQAKAAVAALIMVRLAEMVALVVAVSKRVLAEQEQLIKEEMVETEMVRGLVAVGVVPVALVQVAAEAATVVRAVLELLRLLQAHLLHEQQVAQVEVKTNHLLLEQPAAVGADMEIMAAQKVEQQIQVAAAAAAAVTMAATLAAAPAAPA
jgi:hypothetical protein